MLHVHSDPGNRVKARLSFGNTAQLVSQCEHTHTHTHTHTNTQCTHTHTHVCTPPATSMVHSASQLRHHSSTTADFRSDLIIGRLLSGEPCTTFRVFSNASSDRHSLFCIYMFHCPGWAFLCAFLVTPLQIVIYYFVLYVSSSQSASSSFFFFFFSDAS